MVVKSIHMSITSWRADLDRWMVDQTPHRSFSFEGPLDRRERYRVKGTTMSGFVVHMEREFTPFREVDRGPILGPCKIMDVAADQVRPLGTVYCSENILVATVYIGPSVFDELWTRNVYGGPMPSAFTLKILGPGETGEEMIDFGDDKQNTLAVVGVDFRIATPVTNKTVPAQAD